MALRAPVPGEEITVQKTETGVRLVGPNGDSILPSIIQTYRIEMDDRMANRIELTKRVQYVTTSANGLLFCNGKRISLTELKEGFRLRVPD